jgi:hypothetical protein
MRRSLLLLTIAAACGSKVDDTIRCAPTTTVTGPLPLVGTGDLTGAKLDVTSPKSTPPSSATMTCAADILPAGTIALGPAVTIGPEGASSDRPFLVTLPYKASLLPKGAGRRHVRVVAKRKNGDGTPFFSPVSSPVYDDADPHHSTLTFDAEELTTYQIVADADAGTPKPRTYTYRAIAGISMGGFAAAAIGSSHPEKFDLIGLLGPDPGPSVVYSMESFQQYLFGGFCPASDARFGTGVMCDDLQRPGMTAQHELTPDFERWTYQAGNGVGLTLDRGLYTQATHDLSKALGNPTLYNPSSAYFPPGVSAVAPCDTPVVLHGFKDATYNPDGTYDVITFCDGVDSSALGLGVFDPTLTQTTPTEVLLAVDINGNGIRDAGEPVIVQGFEPFQDYGTDGIADKDEPNYDPVMNPDPDGDDYDAIKNPRGTEGNYVHDEGEWFGDYGIDGVDGTGDYGEGDGMWTVNPNVQRWYDSDAPTNLVKMGAAMRAKVSIWADGGIRDFLNSEVSSNMLAGEMFALGMPMQIYDDFNALDHSINDNTYDFSAVAWPDVADNVYVRYGNPDSTDAEINMGDGRHVGNGIQIVDRVTTLFNWIDRRWPNGDRAVADATADNFVRNQMFTSPTTGRVVPYDVFLPPGYMDNPSLRYPVVYFLHGYGQTPDDLIGLSGIFANYMIDPQRAEADRFQKMIIVYVDGRCRAGDDCESGTFYADSPVDPQAQMETHLFELMTLIDQTYRTKMPETVDVPE